MVDNMKSHLSVDGFLAPPGGMICQELRTMLWNKWDEKEILQLLQNPEGLLLHIDLELTPCSKHRVSSGKSVFIIYQVLLWTGSKHVGFESTSKTSCSC